MKYLLNIEIQEDLIVVCRLMNVLRRKGAQPITLAMSRTPEGYCLMTLAEIKETDAEHLFHFIRRAEGVQHAAYYRHDASEPASYVLLETSGTLGDVSAFARQLPGSRLVLSGHGSAVWEVPSGAAESPAGAIPFTMVRSTRAEAAQ